MTDTLFADISEWQPPLDDSYPYRWLSIRSNDGTYRDRNWSHNWDTARRWLDSGRLRGVMVYVVYRPNWRDCLDVHRSMQAENRPDVVSMVDVESWGGQLVGDHSAGINRLVWGISDWRGTRLDGRPRRVVGYWNPTADSGLWRVRPSIGFIVPSYGHAPRFATGVQDVRRRLIAHQYTDGAIGCGGDLPCGYGSVRCDMNSANGRDPEQLRIATGIGT